MMQPDLFTSPRQRTRTLWNRAEARKHRALAKAPDGWVVMSASVLRAWAPGRGPFMAEDFRDDCLCSRPDDPRHWGAVFQYAKRQGWIKAIGYAPAKSSNCAPKVQWVAA